MSPAQLVFEDITGAVCKGLISRGSLKEGLFQQLTIESPMGKYLSELTDIDSEHKEFKITLVDPGAGRALVPFTVTAPSLKSSQGRTILATVQCSREGPRIAPPAFIYSSRLHGDDVSLKRNERRRFKIKSADELQLTEVIVSDVADSLLIGIVDTDRKSFTLEFTNLPVRSLNTTVAVKYVNQSGNRIGSINLPIRIYVAAEGDKSQ